MDNSPNEAQDPTKIAPTFGEPTAYNAQNTVPVVNPTAPSARPMEQVAVEGSAPKKKRSIGVIIGIVLAALLLVGGAIAAIIIVSNMQKRDSVAAAMEKIMNGDSAPNVAIDGNIEIVVNNKFSPITNIKISLDSGLMAGSLINSSVAKATFSVRSVGDFTVEFDELYASDGDLYFKIDGATSAIEDSNILYLLNLTSKLPQTVDCGDDEQCQSEELDIEDCGGQDDCASPAVNDLSFGILSLGGQSLLDEDTINYISSMADAIELIDGEWLRVSTDEFNDFVGGILENSEVSCVVDLVSGINTNSNSATNLYSRYPFIKSSADSTDIASRHFPVYRLAIDSTNLANFINSIKNSALSQKVYACLGIEDNVWVDENDIKDILSDVAPVYVEVSENNDFTRLYLKSDIYDGEATVTIDLNFSYPNSINVPEPLEYRDYSDFIKEFSKSIYDIDSDIDNNS